MVKEEMCEEAKKACGNEGDHIASAEEGGSPEEAKEPATTIPVEDVINDVDDKALDVEPHEDGVDVAAVRATRKLAQKQRKRARHYIIHWRLTLDLVAELHSLSTSHSEARATV